MPLRIRRALSLALSATIALEPAAQAAPYFRQVGSENLNGAARPRPTTNQGNAVPGTGDLRVLGPYELRARIGRPFSVALEALGPTGAVAWESVGAGLPAGLSLGPDGVISGVPAGIARVAGIQATARDQGGHAGTTQPFAIDVRPAPSITVRPPGTIQAGSPLLVVPGVADAYGTTLWEIEAGALPAGVSLDTRTGRIEGRPEQKGVFGGIVLRVTDVDGASGSSAPFALTVDSSLEIGGIPRTVPARVGSAILPLRPYLSGAGGAVSWALSASSPAKPAWLAVDPTAGTVTARPDKPGDYPLILRATDHGSGEPGSEGAISSPTFTLWAADAPTVRFEPETFLRLAGTKGAPAAVTIRPVAGNLLGTPRWTLAGTLPAGLVLDPERGTISGPAPVRPLALSGLRVRLLDLFDGAYALSNPFGIRAVPAVTVQGPASRDLEADVAVELPAPTARDAYGAVTWTISPGLPSGLSLDPASGIVSGTPSATVPRADYVLVATDARDGTSGASDPFSLGVVPFAPFKLLPYADQTLRSETAIAIRPDMQGRRNRVAFTLAGEIPGWARFDAETGVISGTPTETGAFGPFRVTARDTVTGETSVGNDFRVTLVPPRPLSLAMANAWIPQGRPSTIRAVLRDASGATEVRSVGRPLPEGLSLDPATGALAGTARVSGLYAGRALAATDGKGEAGPATFSLTVEPMVGATGEPMSATLPSVVGVSEDETLSQIPATTGFAGGAAWSVAEGELPAWASLDPATGRLSGKPTGPGSVDGLVLQALDASGWGARTNAFRLVAVESGILRASLGQAEYAGKVGTSLSIVPRVRAAVGAQAWTLVGGTLNKGLVLDPRTGAIGGIPTEYGMRPALRLAVEDAAGSRAETEPFRLVVALGDLSPSIPRSAYEVEYRRDLTTAVPSVLRADGPVRWSVQSGSLPGGMTLNPDTGVLSGRPQAIGRFDDIVLKASTGNAIGLLGPISVSVTRPELSAGITGGRRQVRVGSEVTVAPTVVGAVGAVTWTVSGTLPAGLSLDAATGAVVGKPSAVGAARGLVLTARDAFDGRTASTTPFEIDAVERPAALDVAGPGNVEARTGEAVTTPAPSVSNAYGTVAWSAEGLPSWLTLDADTGRLHGTPPLAGEVGGLVVSARDADGIPGATAPFAIRAAGNVKISYPRADYSGPSGTPYASDAPTVRHADGALVFALSSGILPEGISVDPATGAFVGTPPYAEHAQNIVVSATDARGDVGLSEPVSVVVTGVTVSGVPETVEAPVGQPLAMRAPTASGATGAVAWDLLSGSLPDWARLGADGAVAGTPVRMGETRGLVLRATDAAGVAGKGKPFTLKVTSPIALAGVNADQKLPQGDPASIPAPTLTGAYGNVTWTLSGELPAGLSLARDGSVSGTPSARGTSRDLVLTATDEAGATAFAGPFALTVIPNVKVSGVASSYAARKSSSFATPTPFAANAAGRVSWSLSKGSLPKWAVLDPATGVISGTPDAGGVVGGLVLKVTDAEGASGESSAFAVTVSSGPKVSGILDRHAGRVGVPMTVTPSVTEAQGAVRWEAAPTPLPAWAKIDPDTGVVSGTPVSPGTVPGLILRATDAGGLDGYSAAFALAIDPALGIADVGASVPAKVGLPLSLAPRATGAVGAVTWTLTGELPAWARFVPETGAVTGVPDASGTVAGLTLVATDAGGGKAETAFTIQVAKHLSVAGIAPSYEGFGGTRVATDAPVATPSVGSVSWDIAAGTLPDWARLDPATGIVSGTPDLPGASGEIVLRATDAEGTTGESAPFVLAASGGFPVEGPVEHIARATAETVLAPPATGAAGAVTWSVIGALPSWARLDPATGAVKVRPDVPGTFADLRLRATDARGVQGYGRPFSILVAPAMRVGDLSPTTIRARSPLSLRPDASDAIGSVAWSGIGFPGWLSIDPATGAIAGTPPAPGVHGGLRARARDATGFEAASREFTVTVTDGLAITALAPAYDGRAGAPLGTIAPGAVPPSPGVTWSATGLPAGLGIDRATGAITGIPQGAGTYAVTVRAVDAADGASATGSSSITIARPLQITGVAPRLVARVGKSFVSSLPGIAGLRGAAAWSGLGTFPGWATVDPSTGAVRGTPPAASASPGLQLQATDDKDQVKALSEIFQIDALDAVGIAGLPTALAVRYDYAFASAAPRLANGVDPVTWAWAPGTTPPDWLRLDPSTGVISGTPTSVAAVSPVAVVATDATLASATSAKISVGVNAKPEVLATPVNIVNRVGDAVRISATHKGLLGTPSWSLVPLKGTLPPGLAIDPATGVVDATVSGVTGAAPTEFAIRLTDGADGATADSGTFSILTRPKLALTGLKPSYATRANGYLTTGDPGLVGAQAAVTYSLSPSNEPAGFSFDTRTGALFGSPPSAASYPSYTITARDAADGRTASATFSLAFVGPLTATGPTDRYLRPSTDVTALFVPRADSALDPAALRWTGSGTFPDGITVDPATGRLAGALGTYATATPFPNLALVATDSDGLPASTAAFKLTALPSLDLSPIDQSPVEGRPFSYQVPVSGLQGAAAQNAWSLTGGPASLTIDGNGRISGTPSGADAASPHTVTVTLRDGLDGAVVSRTFRLAVTGRPILSIAPSSPVTLALQQLPDATGPCTTLTVRNAGSLAAADLAFALSGADEASFTRSCAPSTAQNPVCGTSLAPGSSCSLGVAMAATKAGDRTAVLTASATGAESVTTTLNGAAKTAFDSFTFTTCYTAGPRTGPGLDECQAAYSGQAWANDATKFTTSRGTQVWTVPVSGTYRLVANGASGGTAKGVPGGKGATATSRVTLSAGQKLSIVVGQTGGTVSLSSAGGGGATLAYVDAGTPLVVAGGGGGAGRTALPGIDASTSQSGNNGYNGYCGLNQGYASLYGTGGANGSGGQGCYGTGGAGYRSIGGSSQNRSLGSGGNEFSAYWWGGNFNGVASSQGGFGGGGAADVDQYTGGGGGGGYSGGGAGGFGTSGGGGGSFVSGSGIGVGVVVNPNSGQGSLTVVLE